jgi:hypothetical protein
MTERVPWWIIAIFLFFLPLMIVEEVRKRGWKLDNPPAPRGRYL